LACDERKDTDDEGESINISPYEERRPSHSEEGRGGFAETITTWRETRREKNRKVDFPRRKKESGLERSPEKKAKLS